MNTGQTHDHQLRDVLKSRFGYDRFLPLQEEIIGHVLGGDDALVVMPTGSGKSLCYQLPALRLEGITLVVSPLIALMKDQVDALTANGIPAAFISSALTAAELSGVHARALSGRLKILYVAPERLAIPRFREFLASLRVALVAIDEAHCISEWGHDFRPEYRNLKVLRVEFPDAPLIALTATATERVREDISEQLGLSRPGAFLAGFDRPNLTYLVRPKRDAFKELLGLLRKSRSTPAIIYRFSRRETEELAADLSANGFESLPYHAGLDNRVRRETQERFIRDEVPVIVATVAFGMGIDKPDIRLVVHYDLPRSVEGYYQETGRAGRDGLPSDCVLFYSYGDKVKQEFLIDQMEDGGERERARRKLARMIELCETRACRRRFLLEYFGERWESKSCGGCDICLEDREEFDATEGAEKVLSAVIRTGQRFGAKHVAQVLRGARSTRILDLGHDRLTVHGIMRGISEGEVRELIGLLTAEGLLARRGEEYPTLAVTPEGGRFLRGRESLTLRRPKRRADDTRAARAGQELEYDDALFDRLRALRKEIADAMDVPPFVVFGDRTLQQMAAYLPLTRDSFARINGVGAEKLARFSEQFLAVISEYASQHRLQERQVPGPDSPRVRQRRGAGATHRETGRLLAEKLPIGEIARRRGLAERTVLTHLERLAAAGEMLDVGHLISQDRLAKIREVFREFGFDRLTPVRDLLGQEYSFEELRLAWIVLRQERIRAGRQR